METIGNKIKRLRDKLTQEDLAVLLQVERSTLASWEVDRREPDITTLCRIADFFHVSVDWLVGHTVESAVPKPDRLHDASVIYQMDIDRAWQKVIKAAEGYGFEPEAVYELLEVNAKIALALKKADSRVIEQE